ncbi:MAG: hypothetical protein GFH27_549347n37 [Chloroflexi bacterium AL-W]|nr:hypothetical protein [Chloroflexi bacterium AL-N1]NOK70819.1 hypothetical protein [Chloroflexi bacterium AL-N10]NOK78379.1 hypothetical protein [Chloroflexi bacterium AL-N5]NOK85360.1 hypothetical protein [Chloroflexi bacterium AL-W]NOK92636.1 hypothetical protein [Chloroflexi bacterium AL-N15]
MNMSILIFTLPLGAIFLSLLLNRVVPTRVLAIVSAAIFAATSVLVFVGYSHDALAWSVYQWMALDNQVIQLSFNLSGANWALALVVTGGGALALLGLAVAFPPAVRGFGGLLASLLMVLWISMLGLAVEHTFVLSIVWGLLTLFCFLTMRSSGSQSETQTLPLTFMAGLISTIVLLGTALAMQAGGVGAVPGPFILIAWLTIALLMFGAPPFHAIVNEQAEMPSGIAGIVLAFGLPLFGGMVLTRFITTQAILTPAWTSILAIIGIVTLLVGAAGALSEIRIRRLVGWQLTAQMGLVIIVLGQLEAVSSVVAPALLANTTLTTIVSYLAVTLVERYAGTDDISKIDKPQLLMLPGISFLIAAASSVGVPGTLGFWPRIMLFAELYRAWPWVLPLVLVGSTLMALAYLAPLTIFIHRNAVYAAPSDDSLDWSALVARLCPALTAIPLIVLGVVPQLGGAEWNTAIEQAGGGIQVFTGFSVQIVSAGIAMLLITTPLILRWRSVRSGTIDPDMRSTILTPQALAESLQILVWIGSPVGLYSRLWEGALWLSQRTRWALSLFEQRYYLAGFMISLVTVLLLLLQG